MILIVPNVLRDAIGEKLLDAMRPYPEASESDWIHLYDELLFYYDKHGELPEFEVEKKKATN